MTAKMTSKLKYLNLLSIVIVWTLKIFLIIYDTISFPVYLILQRPWNRWSKINAIRAQKSDPTDPSSPWVRPDTARKHFLHECKTVDEAIKKSIEHNGRENDCLAFRPILNEELVTINEKPITKYIMSDYQWVTYGQFDQRVEDIAKGMLMNGIKSGDNVMIFADTCFEWFTCAQAIFRIGATVATIYSSLNEEGIVHGMNETEVTHVVTSRQLLAKLVRLQNKIPKLQMIIYFDLKYNKLKEESIDGTDNGSSLKLIALSELERMAKESADYDMLLDIKEPKEDDIAVLLYTSGSTGVPKGVKITHKNFLKSACAYKLVVDCILDQNSTHLYIGYLPLAHILEFLTEFILFAIGVKIGYSTPLTLTDMSTGIREGDKGDATLLQPTIMAAVPLVLDRIRKGIYDKINRKGIIARKIFEYVVDYKEFWTQKGFDTPIVNRIFCKKFQVSVGGNLQIMLVGGAPLSQDTQKMIKSCLNVTLLQGYGSTETTGSGCMMDPYDQTLGRVGAPILGIKIKLIDWPEGGYRTTDLPNPRGEILVGSDTVSIGYYKLEAETAEAFHIDSNGQRWFKSGDIGEVFSDGTFKIIDRKKDLIKLQFGEYVSLGKIEAELKSNPFVDNICVYGHLYHSYLVALIVPNQLSILRLAKRLKLDYSCYSDLCDNQLIINYVTNQIQRHGRNAKLNKHEIPQKIKLCSEDWTPDNGLVTAAMKVKRKNIINAYEKYIEMMYENADNNNISSNSM